MKRTGITNKPLKPALMTSTAITAAPPPSGPLAGLDATDAAPRPIRKEKNPLWRLLELVASLRITVWLFVLSFVLVFYGTWAQVDNGIWTVVDKYFRSFWVWIPLDIVLLRTIAPVPFYIPFPGGWLLGGMLLVNLLAAHAVRFKVSWKRSGILLIHSGIVIMMLSELIAGLYQVESRMIVGQGQTVNYVQLDRQPEFAVIDGSGSKDDVVRVPASRLRPGAIISDPLLPFDIQVDQYMVNSGLRGAFKEHENPADRGHGLVVVADPLPEVSGTDPNQTIDYPSAYLTLLDKTDGKPLGTYLFSYNYIVRPRFEAPQTIVVKGKEYQLSLRPTRSYRDFTITLLKFRFDRLPGTNTAKNFQSDVLVMPYENDRPKKDESFKTSISMNSPLRYKGETFYQASFSEDETGTVLQVVRNPGWLLPYISCVVVTLGMLIHFGINLLSFLQKRMVL